MHASSVSKIDAAPAKASEPAAKGARARVLVTGGSGFVGTEIVCQLAAAGYQPSCLARDPEKIVQRTGGGDAIRVVRGDMFDAAAMNAAAAGCMAAIHLIGIIREDHRRGQTFERIHVEATAAVLEACRTAGIRRYLHMSALGTRPNAVSRYHQTKWTAEEKVRAADLDWTVFRPSLIHGPGGEFMQMMRFFCTSRLQPFMPYFGSGRARTQPISVQDVASIFVRTLSMPETIGQSYDLCGPEAFTWPALYDACAMALVGHRRLKISVPVPVAKILASTVMPLAPARLVPYKFNVGQVQMSQEDNVCDPDRIERTFGLKLRRFHEELTRYAGSMP